MGTKDKEKNKAYVAKYRAKMRQQKGDTAYKAEVAKEMSSYRRAKKEENKEEYLKKNADYMKRYRAKKKVNKKVDTVKYSKSMVEDLVKQVLEGIPAKNNVGRPKTRSSF